MVDFVVQSLLLAVFLREPPPLDALQYWEMALGHRPDGFQKHADGTSQAQSEVAGHQLIILTQPAGSRVDVLVQGVGMQSGPPEIVNLDDAIALGTQVVEGFIASLQPGRLAAVITAHVYAPGLVQAVEKMRELLPGLPAPAGVEEATFRIVKNCESPSAPGRTFKQICLWQVAQISYFQLTMALNGAQPTNLLRRDAVVATFDVFGNDIVILDQAAAVRELKDVIAISVDLLKGGPDELR